MRTLKMLLLLLVVMTAGCLAVTSDQGDWSIDFRQGIAVKSMASKTAPDTTAKAGFAFPALVEWLLGKTDEPPTTTPDAKKPLP